MWQESGLIGSKSGEVGQYEAANVVVLPVEGLAAGRDGARLKVGASGAARRCATELLAGICFSRARPY
jgi:hypothetical protein